MTSPIDLRAALAAVLGHDPEPPPRHRDDPADDAAIGREEERRIFGGAEYGWTSAELDELADAQAAREWDARGGIG